ncbi:DUF6158 family protein [Streptosporangium sp. NPDC001559]
MTTGVDPRGPTGEDLLREPCHPHVTRDGTFMHASDEVLIDHTRETRT